MASIVNGETTISQDLIRKLEEAEENFDAWFTSRGIIPESPSMKKHNYFSASRHRISRGIRRTFSDQKYS